MLKDRRCSRCGGLDEFIYEVNGVAHFYCGDCNTESKSTHESYGAKERWIDEAGQ
jgi:hypothetical protein